MRYCSHASAIRDFSVRLPHSGRDGHGITHVLVTVVCRQGRVTSTEHEGAWLMAWRRSNHLRGAFNGDVYAVTPHGWGGYLDHRAGYEPCLDAA